MKLTLFCLLLLNLSLSTTMTASLSSDMEFPQLSNVELMTGSSRKLKVSLVDPRTDGAGSVRLEDYHPINPVPSSKASTRHGPIEHGSPLNPFIPKPPPPAHPCKRW